MPASALSASPVRASAVQCRSGVIGPIPVIAEDDELILQNETQNGEMRDTVIAYGLRSRGALPLGVLTRFFDLPIGIMKGTTPAAGFLDRSGPLCSTCTMAR